MRKSLFALLAIASLSENNSDPYKRLSESEMPSQKQRAEQDKRNELLLAQNRGLQQFNIGGEVIYARNEKNAIRKAKNRGLI